jgi:hypothetical protein
MMKGKIKNEEGMKETIKDKIMMKGEIKDEEGTKGTIKDERNDQRRKREQKE